MRYEIARTWQKNQGRTKRRCSCRRKLLGEHLEMRRLLAGTDPIIIDPIENNTPDFLVGALVDSSSSINVVPGSARYVGADSQAARFSEFDYSDAPSNVRVDIDDGIVLTSGDANLIVSNSSGDAGSSTDTGNDVDLESIVGESVLDTNSLEFAFTVPANTNSIQFDLIYGSEEFPEFIDEGFNDVAGVFLDGVQIAFDAFGRPLTVDNNFFVLNNSGFSNIPETEGTTSVTLPLIQYDGLTTQLTTTAPLDSTRSIHHLKFAIADSGDSILDSGLFLANLRTSDAVVSNPTTGGSISGVGTPGATIFIDANVNGVLGFDERSTVAGLDGSFAFDSLAPGTLVIREVASNQGAIVDLGPGEDLSGVILDDLASNPNVGGFGLNFGAAIPTGSFVSAVAYGNFDGNGRPDLVVANDYGSGWMAESTVSVIWNSDSGLGLSPTKINLGYERPQGLYVGNFGGSSTDDIAIAALGRNPGEGAILVSMDGGTTPKPVATGVSASAIAGGDLNNDGHMDLAYANYYSSSVSILYGDGAGHFMEGPTLAVGERPSAIAFGDLGGDSHIDIAVANYTSGSVSLYAGAADGGFMPGTTLTGIPDAKSLVVDDFDGDSRQDLAVSGGSQVVVYYQGSELALGSPQRIEFGRKLGGLKADDLDQDGDVDLLVASSEAGAISRLENSAQGFVYEVDFPSSPTSTANGQVPGPFSAIKTLAIADLNGDGIDDVAAAHFLRGISVHYGSISPVTPQDVVGIKWLDSNGNGVRDAGEAGISGVEIYLDDGNGVLDAGETSVMTGIDGSYSLPLSGAGTYVVREVIPSGFQQTFPVGGEHVVEFDGAPLTTSYDFGNRPSDTVTGRKWNDGNGNEIFDVGEFGLGGVTIYADLNGNDALDSSEPQTVTDADGFYSISNLGSGTFAIREIIPTGFIQTFPANGEHTVTIDGSPLAFSYDFGNQSIDTVFGRKWNDVNGNAIFDQGEVGISGVTVYADLDGNDVLDATDPQTTTDNSGFYRLTNLGSGTFAIREVVSPGFVQTFPTSGEHIITIDGSPLTSRYDFGNQPTGAVTGRKWEDANGNAIFDQGELGLSGVTIYADINGNDVLDAFEPQATTGVDGFYSLANLVSGTFAIREIVPAGFTQTFPTSGEHIVTNDGSMLSTSYDFGNTPTTPQRSSKRRSCARHSGLKRQPLQCLGQRFALWRTCHHRRGHSQPRWQRPACR